MRRALIIGANGQDGRLLAQLLQERGYAVRGWTRSEPATATPCECETINLLSAKTVERELQSLQPDEIYYLAAFHHSTEERVKLSSADLLQRSVDVHVSGLQNVLQAIKTCSRITRLFYAASSHIFGAPKTELQDEQTPLAPNSAYGISKAAGLRCCQLYREEEGLFAATGILFNHESSLRPPSFLSQKIVRGALRTRRHPAFKLILGDLEARVDWGYGPDYVDAMFRILQLQKPSDFVIASGETHTVREFARIAFAAVGLDWRQHVDVDSSLIGKPTQPLCGNAGKLRAATGWSQTASFEEMIHRLVADAEASSLRSVSRAPASAYRASSGAFPFGLEPIRR
jgi:GDPmannose 4,6-dehydratase